MTKHCCEMMRSNVENNCADHADRFDCPDCLLDYSDQGDSYALIIHDGGSSMIGISYCPWCGVKLAEDLDEELD